ncbi:MAG: hypothetical protein QM753_07435 [Thermomicrobiales bacterium]
MDAIQQAATGLLMTVFSFVPKGMLGKVATFRQERHCCAGKIVPAPRLVHVGERLSAEGGADVPTTWATPQDRGVTAR